MCESRILSLIVPVYNMESYLRQCLESVLFPGLIGKYEVLIVNDGSTDSSLVIAKEFESALPQVFRVIDKPNGGYGSCFNLGLSEATGRYVKMLDSDDMFDKTVFEAYLNKLESCQSDIAMNSVVSLDTVTGIRTDYDSDRLRECCQLESLDALSSDVFIHNLAIRKTILSDCRCPEGILYTDNIIFLHAVSHSQSIFSTGLSLYLYRVNRQGQSVDRSVSLAHYADYAVVLNHIFSCYPSILTSRLNRQIMASRIEALFYLFIVGSTLARAKTKFNEIRKGFQRFLKENGISLSSLNGTRVRFVLRLGPLGYYAQLVLSGGMQH